MTSDRDAPATWLVQRLVGVRRGAVDDTRRESLRRRDGMTKGRPVWLPATSCHAHVLQCSKLRINFNNVKPKPN
jgi:hypothetical protein